MRHAAAPATAAPVSLPRAVRGRAVATAATPKRDGGVRAARRAGIAVWFFFFLARAARARRRPAGPAPAGGPARRRRPRVAGVDGTMLTATRYPSLPCVSRGAPLRCSRHLDVSPPLRRSLQKTRAHRSRRGAPVFVSGMRAPLWRNGQPVGWRAPPGAALPLLPVVGPWVLAGGGRRRGVAARDVPRGGAHQADPQVCPSGATLVHLADPPRALPSGSRRWMEQRPLVVCPLLRLPCHCSLSVGSVFPAHPPLPPHPLYATGTSTCAPSTSGSADLRARPAALGLLFGTGSCGTQSCTCRGGCPPHESVGPSLGLVGEGGGQLCRQGGDRRPAKPEGHGGSARRSLTSVSR